MNEVITIVQTLGFPIACVIACFWFINKNNTRDKDESKEREDKLLDTNFKNAEALNKVTDTIEKSNEINKELSETNKLLVEKVEDKLNDISHNVDKLIEREESR